MSAGPLRVAVVHSYYTTRNPSGENRTVDAEVAALTRAGHTVRTFTVATDDVESEPLHRLRSAARVATGRGRNPLRDIQAFGADVVHVHNLFPNLGRAWVEELRAPLVHTLHNYRPLCANAMLLRDGRVCTDCPDGDRWGGVRHACYRDSRLASLPLAVANRRGPARDPLLRRAERIIVLSEQQRRLLADGGLAPAKLVKGRNFLPEALRAGKTGGDRDGPWLYVGRLREEKGIDRLLDHWPDDERLTIVGDGPQRPRIHAKARGRPIELIGGTSREETLGHMRRAAGLVFPSIWLEPASPPLVVLEALAVGLPTLAFAPTEVAEDLRADGTGAVAEWSRESIAAGLTQLRTTHEVLAARCLDVFERRHTEAAHVERLVSLYRDVAGAAA